MTMKFKCLSLIAVSFGLIASSAAAREWTNQQGVKIQADLIDVKGEGESTLAVLKLADGRTYEIAISKLSVLDQKFVTEQRAVLSSQTPTVEASATAASAMKTLLDGKLVAVNGKRVSKFEQASNPEYFAFYFSASWCGPCKRFTPKLVDFYKANPEAGKKFEVIFVSDDNGESDMEDYMKEDQMPWPAIAFRQVERMKEVKKYAGSGIPCLVLVDREGNVLSHSYEGKTYLGPTKVMGDLEKKLAGN